MTGSAGRGFGLNVDKYLEFRPQPPARIFEVILDAVGSKRQHAVDLGAGTGQATSHLVSHFRKVTAVEIDSVMAETLAMLGSNLDVVISPAEGVEFPEGSLDLVICAMSFHWMDRVLVARRAAKWLRPGGVFATYGYGSRSFPAAPDLQDLVMTEESNLWRPFLADDLRRQSADEILGGNPAFHTYGEEVSNSVEATVAYLVGHLASVSIAAAYARSTDDVDGYWEQFRARIEALDVVWPTPVKFSRRVIMAKKRG